MIAPIIGSAIQLSISGVRSRGAPLIVIVRPSPNISNGLGIANCLTNQNIVANAEYIFILIDLLIAYTSNSSLSDINCPTL